MDHGVAGEVEMKLESMIKTSENLRFQPPSLLCFYSIISFTTKLTNLLILHYYFLGFILFASNQLLQHYSSFYGNLHLSLIYEKKHNYVGFCFIRVIAYFRNIKFL